MRFKVGEIYYNKIQKIHYVYSGEEYFINTRGQKTYKMYPIAPVGMQGFGVIGAQNKHNYTQKKPRLLDREVKRFLAALIKKHMVRNFEESL